MKKALLGFPVIFFPEFSDRESTEGAVTETAAIISKVNDDDTVSVRVFNRSTDGGKTPLREFIKHKDAAEGVRPYFVSLEDYHSKKEEPEGEGFDGKKLEGDEGGLDENNQQQNDGKTVGGGIPSGPIPVDEPTQEANQGQANPDGTRKGV